MKVAIVGSRDYPNLPQVRAYIDRLPKDTIVISGGAEGIDTEAEEVAKICGLQTIICVVSRGGLLSYPDGRADFASRAHARNRLMVDLADKVVAFWDGKSRGTKATIDYAAKVGKPCEVRHAE